MRRSAFPARSIAIARCLSTGWTAMTQASAQTVEQFYKGKTITVLVGTSPGGINDITARFAAKHFSRFIPGNPTINVQFTPGGGGLVTANRIFNASETRRPDARQARARDAAARDPGLSAGEVRSDEAQLARQHVVLWRTTPI